MVMRECNVIVNRSCIIMLFAVEIEVLLILDYIYMNIYAI